MLKNKLFALLIILLLLPIFSTASPEIKEAEKPLLLVQFPPDNPKYNLFQIIGPRGHAFTHNWAFVIDGSNSTSRVIGKLLAGFSTAVFFPTDQLRFCSFLFNSRGWPKFRGWVDVDPINGIEFERTNRWIRRNIRVNSYAKLAIQNALAQRQEKLTIIIISDGGFSDSFSEILKTIKVWQKWRENQGLGRAVIAAIGIENHLSRESIPPYPKDTDSVCQNRMRILGTMGDGGYYLLQKIK